jgi:phosphomevalonate kinase
MAGHYKVIVHCRSVACVWYVYLKWITWQWQDRSVQSQSSMMFCNFCEWKDIQPRIIIKICFLHTERTVYQGRLFITELRNLYREFQNSKKSQNKFTVAIVNQLEAIIRAGRQVKIRNAAEVSEGLRGLLHSIMHNHPQFQNIGGR